MRTWLRVLLAGCVGAVLVGGPLLLILNCSGYNEGTGVVTSCHVDTPLARELASDIDTLLVIMAFVAELPLLVYFALVFALMIAVFVGLGRLFPQR